MNRTWNTILRLALWVAGPLVAYLALPIEGERWAAWMPIGNKGRAYALCFALDVVGEFFVYFFARIRQTEAKTTKRYKAAGGILVFSAVTVLASWGVAFQQLLAVTSMLPIVAALNALIQPATQLGIGYTQAVLEGRFDETPTARTDSAPVQPVRKLNAGQPRLEWWRDKYAQLDGERAQMTPERVRELIAAEWDTVPSPTTLYNWARECVQSTES